MLPFKALHIMKLATAHTTVSSSIAAEKRAKKFDETLSAEYNAKMVKRLIKEIKTVTMFTMPNPIVSLLLRAIEFCFSCFFIRAAPLVFVFIFIVYIDSFWYYFSKIKNLFTNEKRKPVKSKHSVSRQLILK